MKRFALPFIATACLVFSLVFWALPVSANSHDKALDEATPVCASNGFLGLPAWFKYLTVEQNDQGECDIKLPQNADGSTDVSKVIAPILLAVFEIILRIAGLAAVGFIIFGGFQYLISQGEPERTKGAKSTILNAIIGLAIALSATAIVNLIGKNIT